MTDSRFTDLLSAAHLLEGIRCAFDERAAIRQHDGEQSPEDAELAAWAEALGAACRRRDAAEQGAHEAAQRAGEAFCDEIGVYDFREMTEGQATEFTRRVIATHRATLAGAQ